MIAVKSPVEFVLSEAKERSEQLIKEQELIAEMERASSDERIRKEIQEHFCGNIRGRKNPKFRLR